MNNHFEVIAVSSERERLEKFGKANGVRTFTVEMTRSITPPKDIKAVFKLYNFLKKEKPLIVHTHTPKAGIVGMMAAKMAGVPIRLHTVAGLPLMESSGIKRYILEQVEGLTYRLATKIYPNSYGLQEIILDKKFSSAEKLQILGKGSSNGIDTSYFNPDLYQTADKLRIKKLWGIAADDLVLIFVGRLVRDKGINELLQAFKKLVTMYPHITLLLVGPFEQELNPIKEENLQLIKEHSKIIATGYQEDVRCFFAISDLLVFPSYREGFPNVVLQAGSMRLPTITSNINGCNEIICEGINGIIIPVKDEKKLFLAIERFIKDVELRKKISGVSREIISQNYERKKFWEILLKEYKTLEQEITKG
ncbi:glycosyltransferase family 4 protein [Salinimicrobium sp. HB62]|uniref:glycosyltransferase family 4 protein n=1 Tax=Salinimicrobium sp. HB62 TaxID=3077781 RepID=UPI002D77426A|nr:glycosyltransferase family 4 protein [Salinimicrobium sp. HB62]